MITVYGNYRHKVNSSGITISSEVEETDTGVPYRVVTTCDIEGRLVNARGAPASKLDSMIYALENAYSVQGQDFGILHDDGRPTAVYWRNSQSIGGIRTKMLAYPKYQGGEYCTYRSFRIGVKIVHPLGPAPRYTRFSETLNIEGGGEVYGVREVNYGPGVRQRKRTHQKCTATQTGTAVCRGAWPIIPDPIWPFALVTPNPKITRSIRPMGGQRTNNLVLEEVEVSWAYEYEWTKRLDGIPHYSLGT